MEIKRINIIGAGNVANYLVHSLQSKIKVLTIYSKHLSHARELADKISAKAVDNLDQLAQDVDLNVVCVKDDAIQDIIYKLPKSVAAVHTSGALALNVFTDFEKYGILYPLQTISKARVNELAEVPFLIESNDSDFEKDLLQFCKLCSEHSLIVTSENRLKIHLAAVFANNFANYFLSKAKDVLDRADIDFKILQPLMNETIHKAFEINPRESQTGPAKRGDEKTLKLHESLIEDKELRDVYTIISSLIKKEV